MSYETAENKLNTESDDILNNSDNDDIFYMDSVERIKLIGTISDCDTQTLLNAYIEILGIESLRPFLLTTFFKSIPIASSHTHRSNKKLQKLLTKDGTISPPPLPPKLLNQTNTKSSILSIIKIVKNIAH